MKNKYSSFKKLLQGKNGIFCICALFFLCLFFPVKSNGQDNSAHETENRLKKAAASYFDDGDYANAYPLYSQLLSLYPHDPNYNYRFGACILYTKADKEKAIQYLNFAIQSQEVEPLAYYYYARALHLNYRFNQAIRTYQKFQNVASAAEIKKYPVKRLIEMCNNGKDLLASIHSLDVLRKKELSLSDYYVGYQLPAKGSLLKEPDGFETKIDVDKKVSEEIYLPPDRKEIFFSSYGPNDKEGKDIYVLRRKPDGTLGDPENLGYVINTEYDEDYPYYDEAKHTLYFSSKGHNSMGGYDIFKSVYDESTKTWSVPVNLDFPINTPDDDILFMPDSAGQTAFFSSTRSSPLGSIDVYKIVLYPHAPRELVVTGTSYKDDGKTPEPCKITIKNAKTKNVVGVYNSSVQGGDYSLSLPNGGNFIFTIEMPDERTQTQSVVLPFETGFTAIKQDIRFDPSSGNLQIKEYPNEIPKDSDFRIAFDYIKEQAQMDVSMDTGRIIHNLKVSKPGSEIYDTVLAVEQSAQVANNSAIPQNQVSQPDNTETTNSNSTDNKANISVDSEQQNEEAAKAIDFAEYTMDESAELNEQAKQVGVNSRSLTPGSQPLNDSLAKAKNFTSQSDESAEKGMEAYQLAAALKSDNSSSQSENAGDLIRRQAQKTKEDSFEVAQANDNLKEEIDGLQQQSKDYISQAQNAKESQEKIALLQQAKDLDRSKEDKEVELKENKMQLDEIHDKIQFLTIKSIKADSISKNNKLATKNNSAKTNGKERQPDEITSNTELKKEIDDYVASMGGETQIADNASSVTSESKSEANTVSDTSETEPTPKPTPSHKTKQKTKKQGMTSHATNTSSKSTTATTTGATNSTGQSYTVHYDKYGEKIAVFTGGATTGNSSDNSRNSSSEQTNNNSPVSGNSQTEANNENNTSNNGIANHSTNSNSGGNNNPGNSGNLKSNSTEIQSQNNNSPTLANNNSNLQNSPEINSHNSNSSNKGNSSTNDNTNNATSSNNLNSNNSNTGMVSGNNTNINTENTDNNNNQSGISSRQNGNSNSTPKEKIAVFPPVGTSNNNSTSSSFSQSSTSNSALQNQSNSGNGNAAINSNSDNSNIADNGNSNNNNTLQNNAGLTSRNTGNIQQTNNNSFSDNSGNLNNQTVSTTAGNENDSISNAVFNTTRTKQDALLESLANAAELPKNFPTHPKKLPKGETTLSLSLSTLQYSDPAANRATIKAEKFYVAANSLVDYAEKTRAKAQEEKDSRVAADLYNKADSLDQIIFQLNLKGDGASAEANFLQYYANVDNIGNIDFVPAKQQMYRISAAKRLLKDAQYSYQKSLIQRQEANQTESLTKKHQFITASKASLDIAIMRQQHAEYLYYQADSAETAQSLNNSDKSQGQNNDNSYENFISTKAKKKPSTAGTSIKNNENYSNPTESDSVKSNLAGNTDDNSKERIAVYPPVNSTNEANNSNDYVTTTPSNKKRGTKNRGGFENSGSASENISNTSNSTNQSNSLNATNTFNSSNPTNPSNVANSTYTPNASAASESEGSDIFEETSSSPYSESNPIPIDPVLPKGLIFNVQVGAFKNPIPQDLFQGFRPMMGQTAPGGFIRYSAGLFRDFYKSKRALGTIKNLGYSDAFIIAFYDGKRISISEALAMLGIHNDASSASVASSTDGGETGNNSLNDNNSTDADRKISGVKKSSVIYLSLKSARAINDTIPPRAKPMSGVKGLVFTVQVGSFTKHKDFTRLRKLKKLYSLKDGKGGITYNAGIYKSIPQANAARSIITANTNAKDAYIVAYNNGKRISLTEATHLLDEVTNSNQGSSTLNAADETPKITKPTAPQNSLARADTTNNSAFKNDNSLKENTTKEASSANNPGVYYSVQIGSFAGYIPVDTANKILMEASAGIEQHKEKHGITSYSAGRFDNYKSASALQQKLYSDGFHQAFIVAFKNGNKISIQEAQSLINK